MKIRSLLVMLPLTTAVLAPPAIGDEPLPLVFEDRFADGADRWEPTDPAAWTLRKDGDRTVWGLNKRTSNYTPKVRSPHNVALIKDLELTDTEITFQVKSTLDTGGHRDCCVFFNYRDPEHFYYVHLGAKPDPASGQIMIVDGGPRRPLTKNSKPVPWDDQWHTVKLVRDVATGRIAVYFDDLSTPLMETTDKTFTSGRVGIGSFDDMNDFTSVKVSGRKAAGDFQASPDELPVIDIPHSAHEPPISSESVADVPLAGLSFRHGTTTDHQASGRLRRDAGGLGSNAMSLR